MKDFIIDNKEWLIGVVASISAYFGGRKTRKSNEKSAELQNLGTIRDLEKELVEDAINQIEELREIIEVNKAIIEQKDAIIKEQEKIIAQQNKFLDLYKKKYGEIEL